TSVTGIRVRSAARNRMSLMTLGQASASTQMCMCSRTTANAKDTPVAVETGKKKAGPAVPKTADRPAKGCQRQGAVDCKLVPGRLDEEKNATGAWPMDHSGAGRARRAGW